MMDTFSRLFGAVKDVNSAQAKVAGDTLQSLQNINTQTASSLREMIDYTLDDLGILERASSISSVYESYVLGFDGKLTLSKQNLDEDHTIHGRVRGLGEYTTFELYDYVYATRDGRPEEAVVIEIMPNNILVQFVCDQFIYPVPKKDVDFISHLEFVPRYGEEGKDLVYTAKAQIPTPKVEPIEKPHYIPSPEPDKKWGDSMIPEYQRLMDLYPRNQRPIDGSHFYSKLYANDFFPTKPTYEDTVRKKLDLKPEELKISASSKPKAWWETSSAKYEDYPFSDIIDWRSDDEITPRNPVEDLDLEPPHDRMIPRENYTPHLVPVTRRIVQALDGTEHTWDGIRMEHWVADPKSFNSFAANQKTSFLHDQKKLAQSTAVR